MTEEYALKRITDPRRVALQDIAEYDKIHKKEGMRAWKVSATHLDNKHTRRLNQELGLWSINRFKEN